MYICTECGLQYKNKPQYCDCGNDEFREQVVLKTSFDWKHFFERMGINPYSLLFLLVCIILSFVILFCVESKLEIDSAKTPTNVTKPKTNIPDIDTLWIESMSKVDNIQVVEKQIVKQQKQESKTVKTVLAKNNTKNKISNNNNQTQKQNIRKNTKTNPAKITKTTVSASTDVVTKKNNTPNSTTQTKSNSVTIVPKTVTNQDAKKNNQELYNYKIQLRQALFSKLSVALIQGSGECGIEFAIDSTGKLINRNFTYQSDNKTVNDEVYKMLMRLPKYYPPPAAYNGEKIKMVFSFDNGSYSINYTN